MNTCLAITNASFICCRLKPKINFEYPNLYNFKYLCSAFAIGRNSSINYCDYFIFHKTVSLFVTIYSKMFPVFFQPGYMLGMCLL